MDVTPRESFEAMDFRPGHADTRKLGSRVNSLPTRLHSDSRTRSGRGSPQQEEEESLTGWIREQPRAEMQYSLYESLNYETVMSKLYLNHLRVREQQESRKFYGPSNPHPTLDILILSQFCRHSSATAPAKYR